MTFSKCHKRIKWVWYMSVSYTHLFPQVAGMEYTINIGVPYDKGELYPGGSTFYAPASIRRVSIQSVGGKPFDVNATYTIAANSHIAAGGATYYVFTQAEKNEDTKIPLDQLVCEYIAEELGGTITAEQYSKTEGRITIIDEAPISYTDVAQDDWFYDAVIYATEHFVTVYFSIQHVCFLFSTFLHFCYTTVSFYPCLLYTSRCG